MTPQIAALVFAGATLALALFQLALAAGAPWGHLAWGGQHRRLPTPLRWSSGLSILLYAGLAMLILARAGLVPFWQDEEWLIPATWAVTVFLGLGVLLNAISRSRAERLAMTPLATLMALCATLVAMSN